MDFEELFAGPPGESGPERAARLAAARDILIELWEQSHTDEIAFLNAVYAAQLGGVAVLNGKVRALQPDRVRKAA
ncbi:hypothetical protein ACFP1Z_05390 [Streptomyces gamaensis]|uniref:Uncharacterized protein n=1 Tax=Streptomyces gamaensis TaxID=1763542 RepID=A0ABW0YUY8_9ACTN